MKKIIYCPICNMRLLDAINESGKSTIEIKCVRCRKVVKVELKETEIKTLNKSVNTNV